MYQDNSAEAVRYLREAVPLMVKYQIPPTPYNYALWYSYVSHRDPQLNAAMDRALEYHGTCPQTLTESLFRHHIIQDQVVDAEVWQDSLKAIISELKSQISKVLEGTDEFHSLLQSSSDCLKAEPKIQDLEVLVSDLVKGTQVVSQSTYRFRDKMAEAQQEIMELREALRRSQKEAQSDPLTGLYNRRYFERHVHELINEQCCQHAIILVDIDHFKTFNDTYGHLMGDKVLQRVALLLQKSLVDEDIAVRFGGEEFLLLMHSQSLEGAVSRAEKVRRVLESISLKDRRHGKDIRRITASFGVAHYQPGESLSRWLERADAALYEAKSKGRNQVVCAP